MSANAIDAARAAELEVIVARADERVRTDLARLRTQREYGLSAFSRKVPYAAGRRYCQLTHGDTPPGYPVVLAGRVLLALRLLPRLVADGLVTTVYLEQGLGVRYTGVPPTTPVAKPTFADELRARDMTGEDVNALARFGYGDPAAWRWDDVWRWTRGHEQTTVVATYRGQPVGFASYRFRGTAEGSGPDTADAANLVVVIHWIVVARKWRRRGVGRFLIRMIEQRVRAECAGKPTEGVTYRADVRRACLPVVPFFVATGFVASLVPGNGGNTSCVREVPVPVERSGIAPFAS